MLTMGSYRVSLGPVRYPVKRTPNTRFRVMVSEKPNYAPFQFYAPIGCASWVLLKIYTLWLFSARVRAPCSARVEQGEELKEYEDEGMHLSTPSILRATVVGAQLELY